MEMFKSLKDKVTGKKQDSKDSLDKSAVKSKISGEPLDIIAHILQNVFERHHEDIKIMRKTLCAQLTVIDLLKSENATQNDDTDAQFEKKSEVGLKTLDDLIVFQSFQIKCAEQSSNGMKDWLCYFIEQSGTKLPPAFTSLRKGISKAYTAPNIGEHMHLYSIELQKTLDKVEKDIVDIEKLFHRDHKSHEEEYVIVNSECSREFQQDASDNGIDQYLIDDLEKFKQTNSLECERIEKLRLELENNLKEFIIDSKNTKENEHSAIQLPYQQSVDTQRSEDMSSLRQHKNTCRDRIQRIDDLSKDTQRSDTSQPQTKERDGAQVMGSHVHSKFPLKNTCRDRIQKIDDSNTGLRRGDTSRLQTEKTDNAQARDESKSITDGHQEQKIINIVKEICDIHKTDVTVMWDTIGGMGELLRDIKESQKQSVIENLEPERNADLTYFHDLIKTHNEQLTCAEQSSEKIKVLFCNAVELLLSPLATLDSNKEKEGSPTSLQTNTGEIRRTANTNIPTLHNEQTDRVGNNAVHSLKYFVATLGEYITQFNEAEKHMEAALLVLKKSQTKRQKEKHKTVDLQLYYDRNDEVMMNVVRCMDNITRHELKKYKMDVTVEYCNTPENLKPNAPVLVLFINTSKLGTDTVAAIKRIDLKDRRNVALVAFHHTDVSFSPIVKDAIGQQFDDIAGVHHMAFLTEKGVYACKDNSDAINDIVSFIGHLSEQ